MISLGLVSSLSSQTEAWDIGLEHVIATPYVKLTVEELRASKCHCTLLFPLVRDSGPVEHERKVPAIYLQIRINYKLVISICPRLGGSCKIWSTTQSLVLCTTPPARRPGRASVLHLCHPCQGATSERLQARPPPFPQILV